jgi:mono/diheme cytochrome c family protein
VKSISYGGDDANRSGDSLKQTITGTKIATFQGFPRDLKIKEATVANGQLLFDNLGCSACHSVDGSVGHGPTLAGLFDSERMTEESEKPVKADAAYILEAIKSPGSKTAKGFPPNYMPPYQLKDPEYQSLVLYIQSIAKGE